MSPDAIISNSIFGGPGFGFAQRSIDGNCAILNVPQLGCALHDFGLHRLVMLNLALHVICCVLNSLGSLSSVASPTLQICTHGVFQTQDAKQFSFVLRAVCTAVHMLIILTIEQMNIQSSAGFEPMIFPRQHLPLFPC